MIWKEVFIWGMAAFITYMLKEKLWEMLIGIPKRIFDRRDKYRKRKDLIDFLEKWFSNAVNLNVSSGRLDINVELEFGSYRLNKLVEVLKAMRVCTLSKGKNYWFFSNFSNNYTNTDVKNMISDINKGLYDQYLM